MILKITVRKSWSSHHWWVTTPDFGFTPARDYRFDDHKSALAWAVRLSCGVGSTSTITPEAWAPGTMRARRQ